MSNRVVLLVSLVLALSAGSALAEECYPENLYREYWEERDILATITKAEQREMPTSRDIARKWPDHRGKWYAGQKWGSGDFEEWSVAYRTEQLLLIRREAWVAKSPARAKKLESCRQRNQVAREQEEAEAEVKRQVRAQQMEDEHFVDKAKLYRDGEMFCLNDNCRVCKDGTCTPVGKRRDQPSCAGDRESYRCNVEKRRRECKADPSDTSLVCRQWQELQDAMDEKSRQFRERRERAREEFRGRPVRKPRA